MGIGLHGEEEDCAINSDYVFTGPDGRRHALGLAGAEPASSCMYVQPEPETYTSGGDTPIIATCGGCSSNYSPVIVTGGDGTVYNFENPTAHWAHPFLET